MNINTKNKKKIITGIAVFFVICILFLVYEIFIPVDINSKEIISFSAEKGQGSTIISHKLRAAGLIKWDVAFQFYVFITNTSSKLQAGLYEFSKSMNISEITHKLYKGEIAKNKITIIEGWNLRDIAENLEKQGIATQEEFFALVGSPLNTTAGSKDYSADFPFLKDKSKNANLEGYLFPDTYEIRKGATLDELVAKILQNFDKKLTTDLKREIKKQNKDIYEIITVASLIEKEVKTMQDKQIVSGIIWKRLENNMALNIDATLTYILDKNSTKISIAETKTDSPYNTYKYRGLPLGPICNPGIESIQAALYPKYSDYFYYLSAPDGKTIFSKTLEEHNAAVQKYLK